MQVTVLGQVAGVAGRRRRLLAAISIERAGVHVAAGLRQRGVRQAAALRRLRRVDAVVISHLHADHFLDLVPFSYALTYAPRQQPVPVGGWPGTDDPARPVLHVPAGRPRRVPARGRRVGQRGPDRERVRAARVRPRPRARRSGRCACASSRCRTSSPTHAVEFAADGAGRLTYGADHSPTDDLVDFARDTDLLLIEATLPRPEREGPRGHLTPGEAGEHGRRARRAGCVLTHISDELDADWARAEAERAFGGPVELAHEGAAYIV